MTPDLSERYNEGVVAAPELPGEVPTLRRPEHWLSSEMIKHSRRRLFLAIIISAVLGALCLLMTVAATYVGGLLWP